MSSEYRPPILEPVTPVDEYGDPDDRRDELAEKTGLPAHEIDEDETVGGGVLSHGGTAIDRGTRSLDGFVQGETASDETGEDELIYDEQGNLVPQPVDPNRRAPLPPRR